MMTEIDRAPSEEEARDFIQVGLPNIQKEFLKKLAEVEMKYTKLHKPYDSQCAIIDWKLKCQALETEDKLTLGYAREIPFSEIDKVDFEQYGNPERFTIVREDEEVEFMNINGIRTATIVGKTIKYKCKRNHGISVFIPTPHPELNQVELLQQLVEVVKTLKENK